jgi:hypothetical protein
MSFLGGLFHGIIGGVTGFLTGGPVGAVAGAAAGIGLTGHAPNPGSTTSAAPLSPSRGFGFAPGEGAMGGLGLPGRGVGTTMPVSSLPASAGGGGGAVVVQGPDGKLCTIRGHHLNKSKYFKKRPGVLGPLVFGSEMMVDKGTACVKNRRMNVGNARALRHALRRARGFEKLAMRTIHLLHPRKGGRFAGFKTRTRKR